MGRQQSDAKAAESDSEQQLTQGDPPEIMTTTKIRV